MKRNNQYNIQVYNFYLGVPPHQNSALNYLPTQITNYNQPQPQPHSSHSQIFQPSISQSTPLPPTYGQTPYVSGTQDPNYSDIHSFTLLNRGKGIDQNEYYYITHSANDALQVKEDPLSNGIIKRIKKSLGGEWMVFASIKGLKGYDFSLSIVTGNDFLAFYIGNFHFQVCRLRD